MEKINWIDFSNAEIKAKQIALKGEYESIKVKIEKLIDDLDSIDKEYNKSEEELNKRGIK